MVLIRRLFCAILAAAALMTPAYAEDAATAYLSMDTPIAEEAPLTEALVRLHVVAEDDSEAAQALKLEARDAVLAAARPLLADCDSPELAYARLTACLDDLEAAARVCLDAHGCDAEVTAQTGVFGFPDCDYAGLTVPAGDYRALRVTIGKGEGHNWWCVLYPSLCMTGEGKLHSLLADWLAALLGGEAA